MDGRSSIGLIFDLDGTLIESAPAITAVANEFLETLSLVPLELTDTISFIGGGQLNAIVERLLSVSESDI